MTDTEKAALERRIDELCEQVERLRKAKNTMHGDAFEIGVMLVKAREENAKLRELVSGLEHCSQGFACDCCPLHDPAGTSHRRCESLERELGIEVDA